MSAKKIRVGQIAIGWLVGFVLAVLWFAPVPDAWIVRQAGKHVRQRGLDKYLLTNAFVRKMVRVEFGGGIAAGGLEVEMEKTTGKLLLIREPWSGDGAPQPNDAPRESGSGADN